MKLSKLYQNRKYGFPIVILVFFLTCAVVTIPTYFNHELSEIFSTWTRPRYFWQYFSGTFEHGIFLNGKLIPWSIWFHFGGNLSIMLLFGLMIEKMLGSNKLLLISFAAMIAQETLFCFKCGNYTAAASGASGVVYAYAPIALYMIIKVFLLDKKAVWKQLLWYVYLQELIVMWIVITILATGRTTNIYHLMATTVGIFFLLIYRKKIDKEFEEYHIGVKSETVIKNKIMWLIWLLPLLMVVVLVLYFNGNITTYYWVP